MMLVVAYDVADDRRRVRLHTALLGFGEAVQESLFECVVTERQARRLRQTVARIVAPAVDKVHYDVLCEGCVGRREDASGRRAAPEPVVYVV